MSLMKGIGRVGLQKRYFKYDGRPQTELAPEGRTETTYLTCRKVRNRHHSDHWGSRRKSHRSKLVSDSRTRYHCTDTNSLSVQAGIF